jgi:glycogen operon protein
VFAGGVNFSLFCRNGTAVDLLLFDDVEDITPSKIIPLNPKRNRTYHYWHAFVPGLRNGQLYGYRIDGPFEPWNGHRFDATQVLLGPYSHAVAVPQNYDRSSKKQFEPSTTPAMKSVVADLSEYDWEGDTPLRRPFRKTVTYEMHCCRIHPKSEFRRRPR